MFGQNVTHANFSVDDLAAAKSFYVDKLGFSVVEEFDGLLVVGGGGDSKITIYQKDDHTPWNSTVLGIEVDDIDTAVQQLTDAGVTLEKLDGTDDKGVMRDPQMGEVAWFKDPAGNWVCVGHYPH